MVHHGIQGTKRRVLFSEIFVKSIKNVVVTEPEGGHKLFLSLVANQDVFRDSTLQL